MRLARRSILLPVLAAAFLGAPSRASFPVGSAQCLGDGSGGICPCANYGQLGAGCQHSSGWGAVLSAANNAGVPNAILDGTNVDRVILTLTSAKPNTFCVFFQGTRAVPAPFGDGLRCIGNPFQVKLGVKPVTGGTASYPATSDAPISLQGWTNTQILPPAVRMYQAYYRDQVNFCTTFTFNMSSAVEILWV
jgi:hypothetical protein